MAQTESIELRFEIRYIVKTHELHAGKQRRERIAVFRRMRDRQRAQRAPVKRSLDAPECASFAHWRSRLRAAIRASFNAPSTASVPLLVKNTRSMPDQFASLRASGP